MMTIEISTTQHRQKGNGNVVVNVSSRSSHNQPDICTCTSRFSEQGNFLEGRAEGPDRSAVNIVRDAELETIKKGTKEVIKDQINPSVDVITDGGEREVRID